MIAPWISDRFAEARVKPITAGWSHDGKYRIDGPDGVTLLRVSPAENYPGKQEEFAQIARLNDRSEAFPRAVEHGMSPDGKQCFVRYGWVEGKEASSILPTLSEGEQYRYGQEAGRLLRLIHEMPQTKVIDSHAEFLAKMDVRRRQMRELKLEFPDYDRMVAFLEENIHLLKAAPTSFRHGDFHVGNMLIDPAGNLRVIDFNRSDFGDPLDDFGKVFTFSRRESVPFARGQIDGYCPEPSAAFFRHTLCHVLQICAFGLVWAHQFGEEEMAVQHELNEQIMKDFDGLRTMRPKWMG